MNDGQVRTGVRVRRAQAQVAGDGAETLQEVCGNVRPGTAAEVPDGGDEVRREADFEQPSGVQVIRHGQAEGGTAGLGGLHDGERGPGAGALLRAGCDETFEQAPAGGGEVLLAVGVPALGEELVLARRVVVEVDGAGAGFEQERPAQAMQAVHEVGVFEIHEEARVEQAAGGLYCAAPQQDVPA